VQDSHAVLKVLEKYVACKFSHFLFKFCSLALMTVFFVLCSMNEILEKFDGNSSVVKCAPLNWKAGCSIRGH